MTFVTVLSSSKYFPFLGDNEVIIACNAVLSRGDVGVSIDARVSKSRTVLFMGDLEGLPLYAPAII